MDLQPNEVFVFGSNLAGIHGRGAAYDARIKYGAKIGEGVGPTGRCYALPTKDRNMRTMALPQIHQFVGDFLRYAEANPDKVFKLTAIGTGLAGYPANKIAPMFACVPANVLKPVAFGGTWDADFQAREAGPDVVDSDR